MDCADIGDLNSKTDQLYLINTYRTLHVAMLNIHIFYAHGIKHYLLGPKASFNKIKELKLIKLCFKAYKYIFCTLIIVVRNKRNKNFQCQYNTQKPENMPGSHISCTYWNGKPEEHKAIGEK